MSYGMNAVYGHTLTGQTIKFPDDQKRGFMIYGSTQDILDSMEDMYAYLQERYPECKVIHEEDDGTPKELPVIDTSNLTDTEMVELLKTAQTFYLDNKFTVGPVEIKTNRQWLFEAFGITDFPEYNEDDEIYVEDSGTELVDNQS